MTGKPPPEQWRKSRRCKTDHCVEVAPLGDHVLVRDSATPYRPHLRFIAAAWDDFLDGVRDGELDPPPEAGADPAGAGLG